jgi:hypothetical protein
VLLGTLPKVCCFFFFGHVQPTGRKPIEAELRGFRRGGAVEVSCFSRADFGL